LQAELLAISFRTGFLLGLFFNPEDAGDVLPKCRSTFNTTQHHIPGDIQLVTSLPIL
jgi:hypothetical protein